MSNFKTTWLVSVLLILCFVSFSFAQDKDRPVSEEPTWTVNLSNALIDSAAPMLGKQFNKNVTITVGVKGTRITLSLTKATLEEALKAITQPQGWMYIQDKDSITIMTSGEMQQEMKKRVVMKTYQIKYTNVGAISNIIRPFLSNYGKIDFDSNNNQLLISDLPEVLTKVEPMITSLDVPTITKIIPIQYSNFDNVISMLNPLRSPRGTINFDKKTNKLIISDFESNIQNMEVLIAQVEKDAQALPQVNIDCSIIKIALASKYLAGIDWDTCPFIAKEITAQSGVYLRYIDQNKLLDWLKVFGEAELISRKKTTVVPGNPVFIREGAQYTVQVIYPGTSQDTTKPPVMGTRVERNVESGFNYTFNVQPTIDKNNKIVQLTYKVDGVLPESGNRTTYSIGIDNARIKDGYTLVTEDIRRLPIGSSAGVVVEEPGKIKYGSIDLILLITPHILEQEIATTK